MTLKDCPFCGMKLDLEEPDVLYPNGYAWSFDKDLQFKTYHRAREMPKEQWCYGVHCPTSTGGCGAVINGDTKEEAIEKWNRRTK